LVGEANQNKSLIFLFLGTNDSEKPARREEAPIKSQNSYEERRKEEKIQPKSCIKKKTCAIFILLLAIVAMIAIISSIFVFRRPQGSALVGQYKFQHMPGTFLIL